MTSLVAQTTVRFVGNNVYRGAFEAFSRFGGWGLFKLLRHQSKIPDA
jgi:hypothetical protein